MPRKQRKSTKRRLSSSSSSSGDPSDHIPPKCDDFNPFSPPHIEFIDPDKPLPSNVDIKEELEIQGFDNPNLGGDQKISFELPATDKIELPEEDVKEDVTSDGEDRKKCMPIECELNHTVAKDEDNVSDDVSTSTRCKEEPRMPKLSKESRTCNMCKKPFKNVHRLKQHIKKEHLNNDDYYEYKESILTEEQRELNKKLKSRERLPVFKKRYQCKICRKFFTFKSGLEKCKKKHTYQTKLLSKAPVLKIFRKETGNPDDMTDLPEAPLVNHCDHCTKSFSTGKALRDHIEHAHPDEMGKVEKPYECKICGARYIKRNSLTAHSHKHSSGKKYPCGICRKMFYSRRFMKVHTFRLHAWNVFMGGQQITSPYCCDICDFKYSDFNRLEKHIEAVHVRNEEPPSIQVKCDRCDDYFDGALELQYHIRFMHRIFVPFKCPDCDATFKTRPGLLRHSQVHRDGLKQFVCQHCGKEFAYNNNLQKHVRIYHMEPSEVKPTPYECPVCKRKFVTENWMMKCIIKHSLPDDDNDGQLIGRPPLKRDYNCSTCGRQFRQERLAQRCERRHIAKVRPIPMKPPPREKKERKPKETEYRCATCNKVFRHRQSRRRCLRDHEIKGWDGKKVIDPKVKSQRRPRVFKNPRPPKKPAVKVMQTKKEVKKEKTEQMESLEQSIEPKIVIMSEDKPQQLPIPPDMSFDHLPMLRDQHYMNQSIKTQPSIPVETVEIPSYFQADYYRGMFSGSYPHVPTYIPEQMVKVPPIMPPISHPKLTIVHQSKMDEPKDLRNLQQTFHHQDSSDTVASYHNLNDTYVDDHSLGSMHDSISDYHSYEQTPIHHQQQEQTINNLFDSIDNPEPDVILNTTPVTNDGRSIHGSDMEQDAAAVLIKLEPPQPPPPPQVIEQKPITDMVEPKVEYKPKKGFVYVPSAEKLEEIATLKTAYEAGLLEYKSKKLTRFELKENESTRKPKELTHVCDVCGDNFPGYEAIKKHILGLHKAKKPTKCPRPNCYSYFNNMKEVNSHLTRFHKISISQEKPWLCEKCGKRFPFHGNLYKHARTVHLDEDDRPFHQCPICHMKFLLLKRMQACVKRHEMNTNKRVRVHTNEERKKFKCSFCGTRFESLSRYNACIQRHEVRMKQEEAAALAAANGAPVKKKKKKKKKRPDPNEKCPCQICGRIYANTNSRRRCIKRHKEEYEYKTGKKLVIPPIEKPPKKPAYVSKKKKKQELLNQMAKQTMAGQAAAAAAAAAVAAAASTVATPSSSTTIPQAHSSHQFTGGSTASTSHNTYLSDYLPPQLQNLPLIRNQMSGIQMPDTVAIHKAFNFPNFNE